jgi:hypothetical protein
MTEEIEKEFIPHEQSLILKKMRFNEECMSVYSEEGKLSPLVNFPTRNSNVPSYCTAPIYRQVFKWFRDKYNLISSVDSLHYGCELKMNRFLYKIVEKSGVGTYDIYDTYEEAELACIDKLIEIVQKSETEKL